MFSTRRSLVFTFVIITVLNVSTAKRLRILPSQPVQAKALGESMLLTCTTDVPNRELISEFQWLDNKNRTIERARLGEEAMIYTDVLPADPGLTLFITKLTEDMAGDYTCTANYASSEKLISSVRIQTYNAIQFIDAPENQYATIHQDYRVRCEVKANPPPSIDWLKDKQNIQTGDKYVVDSKGLLIRNVQETDDGTYSCRAAVIMTGDLKTRHIKLEVLVPPVVEPLESIEITEGEVANIKCNAIGKPPPTFTWIKLPNNQDLSKADRFGVNKNTGTLVINKVEEVDHAEYKCVAENPAGKAEQQVKINVVVKPRIYELYNITAPQGKQTEIICKAYGRPPPLVTFRKFGNTQRFVNGQQHSDDRIILEQKLNDIKGETFGILTITSLLRSDDGLYECVASNKGGEAYKNGHITVEYKPTFINSRNQPPVWTWDRKPGNLSCLAESIPNATIEWYYGNNRLEESANFKIQGTGPQSFLIVYPFQEKRLFTKYKCVAVNKLGKAEHYVELREAHVPLHVAQARVEIITATTIRFNIVPPPVGDGLPIRAFVVQYKRDREFDWNMSKNKTWSVDSPYIIEDLQPEMTYTFRFAALNDVGLGPWSEHQEHTMSRRSAPDEPLILSNVDRQYGVVNSPYADHFELRWRIPIDNGEPIDTYQIKYCQVRKVDGRWETYDYTCNTEELTGQENPEFRLTGLSSDTHYKIELRAHNAIGYSIPAELTVKTARGEQYYSYYNTCSVCEISVTLSIFAIITTLHVL